jgi:hypothetical protein
MAASRPVAAAGSPAVFGVLEPARDIVPTGGTSGAAFGILSEGRPRPGATAPASRSIAETGPPAGAAAATAATACASASAAPLATAGATTGASARARPGAIDHCHRSSAPAATMTAEGPSSLLSHGSTPSRRTT